jgi:hypothetical protein
MPDKSLDIDLTNASDEDLQNIKNQVLKRLAERAKAPQAVGADYDRHGSGHSRSTPPQTQTQ